MCPDECPGLSDVYGEEFKKLYTEYETDNKGRKSVNARDLWFQILDAQMETGTPYLLYKDACNIKSNQKNVGTIKSSNLCTEIVEYSDENETAVCNLASISLPKCVENNKFNYDKLHEITKIITKNLNKIIDLSVNAKKEGSELIVFPELALTGHLNGSKNAQSIESSAIKKLIDFSKVFFPTPS